MRTSRYADGKECKLTIHMQEEDEGNFLVVEVGDKLTNADFESLAPEFQRLVQHRGRVRVLYEFNDFHGWDAQAHWDQIKFDFSAPLLVDAPDRSR